MHVVLIDHFGRGHSEAPDTLYNSQLYVTELALLMQHIKWEKARIAGLSMVSTNRPSCECCSVIS
jgi:pimeloyl-ACP methyl ester carboxylesterase